MKYSRKKGKSLAVLVYKKKVWRNSQNPQTSSLRDNVSPKLKIKLDSVPPNIESSLTLFPCYIAHANATSYLT